MNFRCIVSRARRVSFVCLPLAALTLCVSARDAAAATSIPVWQNVTPASPPAYTAESSMAFDSTHNRAVLFDAGSGNLRTWDGDAWTAYPLNNVGARIAPIAYDVRSGRIVLFGGSAGGASRKNDTWEWSGSGDWTGINPATSPMFRNGHAMAYDAAREQIVMTGGLYCSFSPLSECADTWVYAGGIWTQTATVAGAAYAPGRWRAAMAYDAARHVVVMFGGTSANYATAYNDTWEYDGAAWTKKVSANGLAPAPRYDHALAYDAQRQKVVLYGGTGIGPGELHWEWDGTNWNRVNAAAPDPGARQQHAMTYDSARNRLVLTGNFGSQGGNEVWELRYSVAYDVGFSVGSGSGTIGVAADTGTASPTTVVAGASVTFTLMPDAEIPNNAILGVGGTCGGTLVGSTYVTNAINADCTVVANFGVPPSYTVTPSAGANGTISPATPQTVFRSAAPTFTVTANPGYSATVGGTCGGTLIGAQYTTHPVVADCTVAASFDQNPPARLTVTAGDAQQTVVGTAFANPLEVRVVDAGGVPLAGIPVIFSAPAAGASATLSAATVLTDADGRAAVTALANGIVGSYEVDALVTRLEIPRRIGLANLPVPTATVTPSAGAHGTISPDVAQTIAIGQTATFAVAAEAGYTASVGGTCGGTLNGPQYTTNKIVADCTVVASFTLQTFAVTPSAGANGSISPNAVQSIGYGQTAAFTVTPASGYVASVGGTCGGTLNGSQYTTAKITADCTVAASFFARRPGGISVVAGGDQQTVVGTAFAQPIQVRVVDRQELPLAGVEVRFSAPAQGASASLSAATVVTDADGLASVTAIANPIAGDYQIEALVTSLEIPLPIGMTNLPAPTAIVTPNAGAHGAISPRAAQTIVIGQTATFTVTADPGYSASVGGSCGGTLSGVQYTTNPVAADCSVVASFAQNTPSRLALSGGDAQQTIVNTAFAQPLRVRVVDRLGAPLSGVPVVFASPAAGAGAILSNGAAPASAHALAAAVSPGASSLVSISDADGLATVTAVANASAGSYAVAASVDGVAPQAFNLTNLPAAVAAPPVPTPALADSALALLALTLAASAFWGLSRR